MARSQQKTEVRSNSRHVNLDGRTRTDCRWFKSVIAELRAFFDNKKLAPELALRAGRSVRVCEKWIAGCGAPDGAAIQNLIDSDIGERVVLAMVRDSAQPWAKAFRQHSETKQLRAQLRDTERRLAALRQEMDQ